MPEDAEGGKDREDAPSTWSAVGRHTGYGLTIVASMGFFMGVGWWLDGVLGVRPLLTVVGALGGGAAGFYHMWRELVVEPRNRTQGPDR